MFSAGKDMGFVRMATKLAGKMMFIAESKCMPSTTGTDYRTGINIADRLKQVQIENMPAIEVIKRFKYDNVFIYADPPYVLDTKAGKQYMHEMTDEDHIELLETLLQHPGPVIISGYRNEIYDETLSDWHRKSIDSLAEYGKKRIETIWMNFEDRKMKLF